jgi:hypothetical protein
VSLSVQIGLLLALGTAVGSMAGFLYKFRGAQEAPAVEMRRPVSSSLALFRSPLYTLGIVSAFGSWGLHVGALALAPISLVQATIAGGLVLLTVLADRVFGFEVTRREWVGVGLTAVGLAFLASTLGNVGEHSYSHYGAGTLASYVAVLSVLALLITARSRNANVLAVAAGLLWAASDTSIKALSSHLGPLGVGVLWHPLALVILVASLVGLLVSARSLQLGEAVPVIALTSAATNLLTIAAGPIVFGEPLPTGHFELAIRMLAFALVIVAAALTPPPMRAAAVEPLTPARSAPSATGSSLSSARRGTEPKLRAACVIPAATTAPRRTRCRS